MFTRTFLLSPCIWLILSLVPFSLAAKAQETGNKNTSIFDHLSRPDVLEITIETDLSSLINKRKGDLSQAAVVFYEDALGKEYRRAIELKTRGKFRRRICQFPPLKLKFSKSELKAEGMSDLNDLKLVTHCLDDKEAGQDYILREYLAYKLYNELTPNSFNVQLAVVTYVDNSAEKLPKVKRYGFIMEDKDQLAQRVGGEVCDCLSPAKDSVATREEQTMALFQYMIGNTDWDLSMNRNLLVVRHAAQGKLLPVGYDFDFSGLVNASYALPNTNHGLLTVRDRIYLGLPTENESLKAAIQLFKEKQPRLLAIVDNFKRMDKSSREDVKEYLNNFYSILNDLEAVGAQAWYPLLNQPHGVSPVQTPQQAPTATGQSFPRK